MRSPLEEILMQSVCHTMGIAPIQTIYHDHNRILAALSPEEQRKLKRKFRKLWRKLARQRKKQSPAYAKKSLGLGAAEPSKSQKKNRKHEVKSHVYAKIVTPIQKESAVPMSIDWL